MKITANYNLLESFTEEDWMEYLRCSGDCAPETIRGLNPLKEHRDGLHTYSWELPDGDWVMLMFTDGVVIATASALGFLIKKGVIRVDASLISATNTIHTTRLRTLLPVQVSNALAWYGVKTLSDLARKTRGEVAAMRRIGAKGLADCEMVPAENSLEWGMVFV